MDGLIEKIRSIILYRRDSNGKVQYQRPKGSSLELPQIDERKTRENAGALMMQLLSETSAEDVLAQLKETVQSLKSYYMQTHDGFRVAKGSGKGRSMTVGDLYALSVAAGYCFDLLPKANGNPERKVGIGLMAPAVQDCGKNLIKLIWKSTGVEVFDVGNTLHPETWFDAISMQGFSAIGISCMVNRCVENVRRLMDLLVRQSLSLPVIIGGIAVNRVTAFDLANEYGLPVYYGQDVNDAAEVLEKALTGSPLEVPVVKEVEEIRPAELLPAIGNHGFRLFRIRIGDIVVDNDARSGCAGCSGDKKRLCPLEIGYEKQKSIEESIQFINSFKFAVLVITENHDDRDRSACKSIWEGLLGVEQHFASTFNTAHAFKFPMVCPFCLPKECKLHKGQCMFPFLYRPLHEQFNINITKTLVRVFGDATPTGMNAIILVR